MLSWTPYQKQNEMDELEKIKVARTTFIVFTCCFATS